MNDLTADPAIRELTEEEIRQVTGGTQMSTALTLGAGALATAGTVTRFIPGAQLLSGGLTLMGIGVGLLAADAKMLKR